MLARWWVYALAAFFALTLLGILLGGFAALVTIPTLPSLEALTDYRPKIPLRVYSADGLLIGEFGEERREVIKISAAPQQLKQAILAAEDDRFYQHGGVDYTGILRAAYSNFTSGGMRQGASTITMQVARNFFLTKEKTLSRKFSEALLAFKIEHSLSKDEILELYFNQIYLGQRAYGFAAAAQVYFGKPLREINLAEAAMLAGLPKAPSRYNPVVNPKRAKARQLYVLRRMQELGYISGEEFKTAEKQPVRARRESQEFAMHADYVAEMARQAVYERHQEDTYTKGFKVYTTIRRLDQEAAYKAVRQGVVDYDRRHGYRGPEAFIDLTKNGTDREEFLEDALQEVSDSDDIHAAVALEANTKLVRAYRKGGEIIEITGDGLKFAHKFLDSKGGAGKQSIRPGSLIRVKKSEKGPWQIVQLPQVEASLVSLDSRDGAVRAMVGGFDFSRNQFNHVTQAWRQPGLKFQALHLFRLSGKRLYSSDCHQRCTAFLYCGGNRKRSVGSAKFRRQLRRPDAHARSAGQIEESGIDSYSSGNGRSICAGLCRPIRFRPEAASALFADGARRRFGNTDTDGGGVCRIRQWRLSHSTLFHPAHRG